MRIVDRFDTNVTFVTIECFGSFPRPCVELSEDIIDFGRINVDTNTNASHALRLANTGTVAASFQFLIDSDCTAWNIYPNQGIVEPGGYVGVKVAFQPKCPSPYFRKVPVLIDGGAPIFLTLSGEFRSILEMNFTGTIS